MGPSTRTAAAALGAVHVLGLVGEASASHNIQRGVSLHYKGKTKGGRFYATTPSSTTSSGTVCRSVRSPVLDLG